MTVIMPVYVINEELLELTKSAIFSLGEVDLVIVDNDSLMGGGYLRALAKIYIKNNQNLGYAKAVNQGLKLANDEYIVIANNDIRVSPNWQKVTKEVFEENGNLYSCHFRMTDYDVPFEYGNKIAYSGMERWCTSSFFVIKSKNPQLYDEKFLNSYDDWDYWYRIALSGQKQAYTDKACYQHHHSFTKKAMNWEDKDENREYFKNKWGIYPEEIFKDLYPDQFDIPYQEGFKL